MTEHRDHNAGSGEAAVNGSAAPTIHITGLTDARPSITAYLRINGKCAGLILPAWLEPITDDPQPAAREAVRKALLAFLEGLRQAET